MLEDILLEITRLPTSHPYTFPIIMALLTLAIVYRLTNLYIDRGKRKEDLRERNRKITEWSLVLSPLTPLAVLMLIKLYSKSPCALFFLLLTALLGALCTYWIINRSKGDAPFEINIKSADSAGTETTGYLASFIFPLITAEGSSAQDWAAYIIFVIIYIEILTSSELLSANPMLYILGYRIWKIKYTREKSEEIETGYLIARRSRNVTKIPLETHPILVTRDGKTFFENTPKKAES
ncbi:hypothetical protein KRX56_05275 [Dermabacteraceae bacterium TAE3-ERU27]|nr:hypothetical protein [Dermabacteraceae bacterium TAE3-ERU27]